MFELDQQTLEAWAAQADNTPEQGGPPEIMGPKEFAEIEGVYGARLPEAYKTFMSTYGAVQFTDAIPRNFQYLYEEGPKKQYFQGHIQGFVNTETLMLFFVNLLEEPDNEEEEPFFPRNMLPFASNMDQDCILLELSQDTPRIWYWEDNPYGWGHGSNTRLGYIAPDLKTFIENLG